MINISKTTRLQPVLKAAVNASSGKLRRAFVFTALAVMAIGTLLDAGDVAAQDLTTTMPLSNTASGQDSITIVPTSGATGNAGRSGSYNCSGTSWGAACVDFYDYGNYDLRPATN